MEKSRGIYHVVANEEKRKTLFIREEELSKQGCASWAKAKRTEGAAASRQSVAGGFTRAHPRKNVP